MALNILYNDITRKLLQIQCDVKAVEAEQAVGHAGTTATLFAQYNALKSQIDSFETMAKREVTEIKREKSMVKAAKIRQDYADLKAMLSTLKSVEDSRKNAQQREMLLQRKSTHQMHADHPYQQNNQETSSILLLDQALKENTALGGAETRIDEFINLGRNALNELYEQRSMLKSTQKRLLDIANSLGLSSSVIRLIEQRTAQDKWILYGGMTLTLLTIIGIWYWLR